MLKKNLNKNKETLMGLAKFYLSPINKKISLYPFILLSLLAIILIFKGPLLEPDSPGYLEGSQLRAPMYPWFTQGFRALFGSYFLWALTIVQVLFGFASAWYSVRTLNRVFKVEGWILGLLPFVLLIPYYIYGFVGYSIVSESLCYPLYLLSISCFLRGFQERSFGYLLNFLIMSVFLYLTRKQFIFLYGFFGLVLLYFFLKKDQKVRKGVLLIAMIGSIAAGQLMERAYQYVKWGHFTGTPFTGFHLVITPLYLSKASDAELFTEPREKRAFQKIYAHIERERIGYYSLPHLHIWLNPRERLMATFDTIAYFVVPPVLREEGIKDNYEYDRFTTKMAITLTKHHVLTRLKLYIQMIILNLNYYYGALIGFLLLISSWHFFRTQHPLAFLTLSTSLLTFMNYAFVGLIHIHLKRYTIYSDTVQLMIFLIIAYQWLETLKTQRKI